MGKKTSFFFVKFAYFWGAFCIRSRKKKSKKLLEVLSCCLCVASYFTKGSLQIQVSVSYQFVTVN